MRHASIEKLHTFLAQVLLTVGRRSNLDDQGVTLTNESFLDIGKRAVVRERRPYRVPVLCRDRFLG
jgi:hypothetical protein